MPSRAPTRYMNSTINPAHNVLTSDVEVKGNLNFSGDLTFDGKLEGDIHTEGLLTLGESAVVNGNIKGKTIVVRGKVNGTIVARDKIALQARAELFGDVRTATLVVEEGVTFVGKIDVNPNNVSPTRLPRRLGGSAKTLVHLGEAPKTPGPVKRRRPRSRPPGSGVGPG